MLLKKTRRTLTKSFVQSRCRGLAWREREREKIKKKKTLDRPQETNECRKREREREREERKGIKREEKEKKRKKEKKEKLENFHPSFHHARLFGKRTTIATTTRRLNALGQLSRRQVHGYEGLID